MWIFSSGSYLALVQHRKDPSLILVRARRREDILRVFPDAKVEEHPGGSYSFHAPIYRDTVALRIAALIQEIDYPVFIDSIPETARKKAYKAASAPIEAWGHLDDSLASSLGLESPEYAPAPPRRAWGPLRANVRVLVKGLEAWNHAEGPIKKPKAAHALEMAIIDLGFVPDGMGQFAGVGQLPQRQEIENLSLAQTLRMLNFVQREARGQDQEDTFTKFLESGLVPALIHRMSRLTA